MFKEIKIDFDDESKLNSYLWDDVKNPEAVVVISHGMAEHGKRYEPLAEHLNKNGFIVICSDHYGHGKSVVSGKEVGVIEKYDFITAIIMDIKKTYDFIRNRYPNLPIYLFAHSMGSMASQAYIQKYPDDFTKVILSGTEIGGIKYFFSKFLVGFIMLFKGKTGYSDFVEKQSIGAFEKPFRKSETDKLAWISHNKENIENYRNDPLCGAQYPLNYFYSISSALWEAHKNKNIKKIKAKEVLLITGDEDPVSNFGKSIIKLNKKYQKNNVNSSYYIIPNSRHESFNECDEVRNDVFNQIVNFYKK